MRREDDAASIGRGWAGIDLDRLALASCVLVGLIVGAGQAAGIVASPEDAAMYWATHSADLYPSTWGSAGGYVNPPPLALLIGLIHPASWSVFIVAFTTATWWAFWYCTRAWAPVVLVLSILAAPFIGGNVVGYLFLGNVQILMAAAVVASVRASPCWAAVPLLTKMIGVSFVWYAARREWRHFLLAVATTSTIVLSTLLLAPGTWADFIRFVTSNQIEQSAVPLVPIAFPLRLVASIALVAWGGWTDRRWTVPIAAGLAAPALYSWSFLASWIGAIGVTWSSQPSLGSVATRVRRHARSHANPMAVEWVFAPVCETDGSTPPVSIATSPESAT